MDAKDKIIFKSSAKVVAYSVVDEIAKTLPGINIAWGLSKALYGAGMKLRQDRALEWVEMVRDNPSIFTEQVLSDEKFQDGFVVGLEKFLVERNETKRKVAKNIFLGFVVAKDKSEFPLEKYTHTLSQMSEEDIATFKDVDPSRTDLNYKVYGNTEKKMSNIYNLINLGLLVAQNTPAIVDLPNAPSVKISGFGKEFVVYLKSWTTKLHQY